jgi:hypothetical protein
MKTILFVTTLIYFLLGVPAGEAARINARHTNDAGTSARRVGKGVGGRALTLAGQGINLTLPAGWRKDGDAEVGEGEYRWLGPGGAELSIAISPYRPEYGGRSVKEETEEFFKAHKEGGSQDVRFLEIDGVRGVHFLVDDEVWKLRGGNPHREFYRFIQWSSQRTYKGRRQVITVSASAPVQSFRAQRDALYAILTSLKFLRG